MSLEFIKPQLATSVDQPPPRAGWIHEVKHDGYRSLLVIERRKARAYTRNGFDWSERYPGITKAAAELGCRSAIIDGEVIVQNEQGVSDFEALNSAIRWHPQSLILCVFDLLQLNGKDLRDQPLLERRAKLKELVPSEHPFLFSEEFTGDAAAFFRACADHQLEGMVSKLASSKYRSGRSKTWLKTKCFTEGSSDPQRKFFKLSYVGGAAIVLRLSVNFTCAEDMTISRRTFHKLALAPSERQC
jgi:bifunctional non-homologous end joining protein LigD